MTYKIVKYRGNNCPWCGVMKHVFGEIMRDNTQENLSFHDVNIEDDMAGVERLKIRSIPTIIVFKWDEELWRKTGVVDKNELKIRINNLIDTK